jgi:hypothetical protein
MEALSMFHLLGHESKSVEAIGAVVGAIVGAGGVVVQLGT